MPEAFDEPLSDAALDQLFREARSYNAWLDRDVSDEQIQAIYQLMKQGRREEALSIYRWFRPLLDLDVSTYLVQNIKLAEVFAINTNDRVRMPRQPLSGGPRTSSTAARSAGEASGPMTCRSIAVECTAVPALGLSPIATYLRC